MHRPIDPMKARHMGKWTSVASFLFSAIALIVPSGYSLGALLLVVGSIACLWLRPAVKLKQEEYWLITVLVLYFVVNCAINAYHHAEMREYDELLRFVLVLPAFALLMAYPPQANYLWSGIAIGAIGAGTFAGWQKIYQHLDRAHGTTNAIQFGNISFLLAILSLTAMTWAIKRQKGRAWLWLLLLGTLMGLLGWLFTGSRGSGISLPICLLLFYLVSQKTFNNAHLLAAAVAVILALGVLSMTPFSAVLDRSFEAVTETEDYLDQHNTHTSIGARIELLRAGIEMLPQHIWLGWGRAGMMAQKQRLIDQGKISPFTLEHTHLHNEYLDSLVKRGIPGLAMLLLLYFYPLYFFARQLHANSPSVRPYALAGTMLMICYIGFDLTQAFLTHNIGVMFLLFMLAIFWSKLREQQQLAMQPLTQHNNRCQTQFGSSQQDQ